MWAVFLLNIFSILLLHEVIPHYNHFLDITFHHGHHGEHRENQKDDFSGVPFQSSNESGPVDLIVEQRFTIKSKSVSNNKILQVGLFDQVNLVDSKLLGSYSIEISRSYDEKLILVPPNRGPPLNS
jgi:hypothetical protein